MNYNMAILAYIGPDAMLPMTSVVATFVGVTLMFGRYAFQFLARVCRMILPRSVRGAAKHRLHLRRDEAASLQESGGARHNAA